MSMAYSVGCPCCGCTRQLSLVAKQLHSTGPWYQSWETAQQLAEAATLLHTHRAPACNPRAPPQVASATNDVAGDGTTTATVLTRAILVEGCKSVAAGMNPMDLRRGINLAVGVAFLCMWHSGL